MAAIVRVRSRDGLERVTVDPQATVGELQMAIQQQLGVSAAAQLLSRNQSLLLAKDPQSAAQVAADMKSPSMPLAALGIGHGSMIFLFYTESRVVVGPKSSEAGSLGRRRMTMDDLIAMQTRIERQEKPHCNSLSFDRDAANAFQHYVHENLAFGVKRGGFMYGTISQEGDVSVEFIYEPPQQGAEESLLLLRDPEEEKKADAIAAGLGMRRVGFIFTQAIGRNGDYTLSNSEIRQAAELHAESEFEHWATGVVKLEVNEDQSADVHFEAFQLSDQCVKLWKEGWFVDAPELDPKLSKMKKDVVVLNKDVTEVDNDFFLVPVKILDHQGFLSCSFPIENRVTSPSKGDLKDQLERVKSLPYYRRISDFHLLLFLSNFLDVATDMPQLTFAIASQESVPDGYQLLINSLADGF